jgi:hypothetical protein
VDVEQAGQEEPVASWPSIAVAAGAGLSFAALVLAKVAGPPYLDLSSLNPFLALFAATAFGALFAVPFAANRILGRARPERAESWEPAMLVWGGVALALFAISALLILPGEFSGAASLADAAGLLVLIESGLVLLVLGAWVLAG